MLSIEIWGALQTKKRRKPLHSQTASKTHGHRNDHTTGSFKQPKKREWKKSKW